MKRRRSMYDDNSDGISFLSLLVVLFKSWLDAKKNGD